MALTFAFLSNGPRVENRQRDSIRLVEWWRKSSSDHACLNFVRAEDVTWVRVVPSTRQDDKVVGFLEWETEAGTANLAARVRIGDDEVSSKRDDKARDNETATRRDNAAGTKWDNNGVDDPGWDGKGAVKLAVGAYIEAWRFSRHAFLLATCSNTSVAFSSLESMIGWPLFSRLGSIANSSLSIILTTHDALSVR